MTIDLSKNPYSSTSALITILPIFEEIKNENISDLEKRIKASKLVEKVLNDANDAYKNLDKSKKDHFVSITQDRITNMRMTVLKSKNFNEAIKYIKNSINNGKNYNGGN